MVFIRKTGLGWPSVGSSQQAQPRSGTVFGIHLALGPKVYKVVINTYKYTGFHRLNFRIRFWPVPAGPWTGSLSEEASHEGERRYDLTTILLIGSQNTQNNKIYSVPMRVVGDTRACSHAMHAMPAGCARSEGTNKNLPTMKRKKKEPTTK